jgi:hypothetical protein
MRIALAIVLIVLLCVTPAFALSLTLAWTNPTDANRTGIKILRQSGGSGAYTLLTTTPLGPAIATYTDSGLNPNTTYCYQIVPTGASGDTNKPTIICGNAVVTTP